MATNLIAGNTLLTQRNEVLIYHSFPWGSIEEDILTSDGGIYYFGVNIFDLESQEDKIIMERVT